MILPQPYITTGMMFWGCLSLFVLQECPLMWDVVDHDVSSDRLSHSAKIAWQVNVTWHAINWLVNTKLTNHLMMNFSCYFVPFFLQTCLKLYNTMKSLLLYFVILNSPLILCLGQFSAPTLISLGHVFEMYAEWSFTLSYRMLMVFHGKEVVLTTIRSRKNIIYLIY